MNNKLKAKRARLAAANPVCRYRRAASPIGDHFIAHHEYLEIFLVWRGGPCPGVLRANEIGRGWFTIEVWCEGDYRKSPVAANLLKILLKAAP